MFIYLIYTRDTKKVLAYFTSEDECLSSYNHEYDSNKTACIALNLDFLMSLKDVYLYDFFSLLLDEYFRFINPFSA